MGGWVTGLTFRSAAEAPLNDLGSLEGQELELLEAVLDRRPELRRQRFQALSRTLVDLEPAHLTKHRLQCIEGDRLIGGHPRGAAAKLARKIVVTMRAQPVREAGGGHDHALGLWGVARGRPPA